ncbi:hypothetical protein E3P84_02276 [Wallemia ichthyophaga]|nr:hypothetical protein E3P84_02276 [Wallemia ichthyophaga]TIB41227.1 hypothetical protein E3P83_02229 [Wallemia ichthyophaga]
MSLIGGVLKAFTSIQATQPQLVSANNVKRAAVALILRFRLVDSSRGGDGSPSPSPSPTSPSDSDSSLEDLFNQPWMRDGNVIPEILFIQRVARNGDRWSGHVACPGGRYEPDDENLKYTAMRECWEEIGLDISDRRHFLPLGQLDDREVTSSLGKKLLMILSPFVFIQTRPVDHTLQLEAQEVESVHWIPVDALTDNAVYTHVEVDLPARLSPKSEMGRWVLASVLSNSSLSFPAIELANRPAAVASQSGLASVALEEENDEDFAPPMPAELDDSISELRQRTVQNRQVAEDRKERKVGKDMTQLSKRPSLRLWGLTLGFTLDFLSHIPSKASEDTRGAKKTPQNVETTRHLATAHVIKALFPSFNSPDINLWMWVCGRRYRSIRRQWEQAARNPGSADRRKNWSGTIRAAHFATIRRALMFAVVFRILAAFTTLSILGRYLQKVVAWFV